MGKRDRIRADDVSQDSDAKFQAKMTKLSNSKPTAVREKTSEPKKKTMGKSQTNLARKKSNARFDGGHLLPSKVIISSPSVYTLIRPDQSITDIGHGDLPFQGDTAMGPDA